MFGRYFGAAYFGPRYWGMGGSVEPEPEPPVVGVPIPAGASFRSARRFDAGIEVFHAKIVVSGGGEVFVSGRASVEYPPNEEIIVFLGMA